LAAVAIGSGIWSQKVDGILLCLHTTIMAVSIHQAV
jgi:hypothetical protein